MRDRRLDELLGHTPMMFAEAAAKAFAASTSFPNVLPPLRLRVVFIATDSTKSRQFSRDSSETQCRSFSGDGTSE